MTSTDTQPPETPPPQINPYQELGGEEGVRRLVDRFYDIMDSDPKAATIRAMHGEDLTKIRTYLFYFLSGWLGGPQLFFEKRPGACIRSAHAPYAIGEAERDEWLYCMTKALEDTGAGEELRKLLKMPFFMVANSFCNK